MKGAEWHPVRHRDVCGRQRPAVSCGRDDGWSATAHARRVEHFGLPDLETPGSGHQHLAPDMKSNMKSLKFDFDSKDSKNLKGLKDLKD